MGSGALSPKQLQQLSRQLGYNLPATGKGSIEEAWQKARSLSAAMPLKQLVRRRANVYQPASQVDRLLESAANASLSSRLGVRQANRNQIVSNLICLLREDAPLQLHRLDIKSFYESIQREVLLNKLRSNWRVPRLTIGVLESLFAAAPPNGLPRGLATSATLSELYLKPFDEQVQLIPEVYFYARFVDDILVLTLGNRTPQDFRAQLSSCLRETTSLEFNEGKRVDTRFETVGDQFDYLGYAFSIGDNRKAGKPRQVRVDIARAKVQRMKTRICLSILAHARSPSFELLRDRIQLLSANYYVGQRSEHQKLRAGIFYSYSEATETEEVTNLDAFLRRVLVGTRERVSQKARASLTASERQELLRLSFAEGRRRRIMLDHEAARIRELSHCWRDV